MNKEKKVIKEVLKELSIKKFGKRHVVIGEKGFKKYLLYCNLNHFYNLIRLIPRSKKRLNVLDVGLGIGYIAVSIRKLFGYKIVGIEHPGNDYVKNNDYKKMLKKYDIKLDFLDITKEKFPFDNESFDVVLYSEVIEHIPTKHVNKIFNEIYKVLKKEGWLVMKTPNVNSLPHKIKKILGMKIDYREKAHKGEETFGHVKEYSVNELKDLLSKNSFKVKNIKMNNYSYQNRVVDLINNLITFFIQGLKNDIMILAQKQII